MSMLTDNETMARQRDALDRALRHIGAPVTNADIAAFADPVPNGSPDDAPRQATADGPQPRLSRRRMVTGVGMAGAAAALFSTRAHADAPPGAVSYAVQADPSREQGRPMGEDRGYGSRSQFETEVRWWLPSRIASFTPMQNGYGIITPSGLHYERHHAGIPNIDPRRHNLVVHGMVDRPMKFSVAELKRFPSVSRIHFMECSGSLVNGSTPQRTHGLVSTSEWTGVLLSTLLRQVGLQDGAAWVLAEGADGSVLSRSVPLDKCLQDAMVVYAQNGEAIRPEQGYPIRLFLPGWEGNASVKWLRRLEVSDKPFMTRWETSKYTDIITKTGKARQFTFVMEAKSVITFPSGEMRLPAPGFYEVTGLAWSGRGKVARVEVSTDGGKTWALAALQDPVLPISQTRFRFPWVWDGSPARIMSRATDETGYTQPTFRQIAAERGDLEAGVIYHINHIAAWEIDRDGNVKFVHPSQV